MLTVVVAVLTGCGTAVRDNVTAAPSAQPGPFQTESGTLAPSRAPSSAPPPKPATRKPAPSASAASAASAKPSTPRKPSTSAPAGASFGVDRIRWPTTLPGARVVLNALPAKLGGQPRRLATDARDRQFATAEYGDRNSVSVGAEYLSNDTPTGERVLIHANNVLASSFGLGYACARGSYRGTAPKHEDFDSPAPTTSRSARPVWFSCPVDAAEGYDDYSGYAVGWTSGRTAWLVIARDATSARALVAALSRAAG